MTKTLLVAALAALGLTISADNAQAGRRCCRTHRSCGCASACNTCASTCNSCNACSASGSAVAPNTYSSGAVTDPTMAPPPPQSATAGVYQSYSYEPAAAPLANNLTTGFPYAPQSYLRTPSNFQFRGDRKALGNY